LLRSSRRPKIATKPSSCRNVSEPGTQGKTPNAIILYNRIIYMGRAKSCHNSVASPSNQSKAARARFAKLALIKKHPYRWCAVALLLLFSEFFFFFSRRRLNGDQIKHMFSKNRFALPKKETLEYHYKRDNFESVLALAPVTRESRKIGHFLSAVNNPHDHSGVAARIAWKSWQKSPAKQPL